MQKLLLMLKEREQLGIPRQDANLRHIIISKKKSIKVIDHVNSYRKIRPVPKEMFTGLKKLGVLKEFLRYVEILDKDLFSKWKKDKTIGPYF